MLSTPAAQVPKMHSVLETVENQIFSLHLRRQVLLQIETSIGYLLSANGQEKQEAQALAVALASLRAHRRERQSKTPSKV